MAYRFAAALGAASFLAQSVVAMPAPQVQTITVTATAPVATVVQEGPNGAAVVPNTQHAASVQTNAASHPAPSKPATPTTQEAHSQPAATSSPAKPTGSSSAPSTSNNKIGAGVCVDGTMANGASAAKSVVASAPGLTWWNNWGQVSGGDVPNAKFFPELHLISDTWQSSKTKGDVAIAYNELDVVTSAADACTHYKSNYLPGLDGMKATTPSVTSNSSPGKGADWIDQFYQSCSDVAGQIAYTNAHFYLGKDPTNFAKGKGDGDFDYFGQYLDKLAKHGKPILLTELGLDPTAGTWSSQQVATFMGAASKYLKTRSDVAGWAGFQVGQKPGNMNPADQSSMQIAKALVS